jgi:YHS domain-containing protein
VRARATDRPAFSVQATDRPKQAAATTLEWHGQKFYFVGEEARREFAKQNKIPIG